MPKRDPKEEEMLTRGHALWQQKARAFQAELEAKAGAMAPTDVAELTDEQAMIACYGEMFRFYHDAAEWKPEQREQRCGWCIRAAGNTREAWDAVDVFIGDAELVEHVIVCEHNPLVKKLALLASEAVIDAEVIAEALTVIGAASKGPAVWCADRSDTPETARARWQKHYDLAMELTGSAVLHQVDLETGDGNGAFCFAVTGNGPSGAQNARFIAGALSPEAGWEAALRALQWAQMRIVNVMIGYDEAVEDRESMAQKIRAVRQQLDNLGDRYDQTAGPLTEAELVRDAIAELHTRDEQDIDRAEELAEIHLAAGLDPTIGDSDHIKSHLALLRGDGARRMAAESIIAAADEASLSGAGVDWSNVVEQIRMALRG